MNLAAFETIHVLNFVCTMGWFCCQKGARAYMRREYDTAPRGTRAFYAFLMCLWVLAAIESGTYFLIICFRPEALDLFYV